MIFNKAEVLLPKNANMSKWSVVACDQYTSEPKYWSDVEAIVGNDLSAYHLILPEIYLSCSDVEDKIKKINQNMQDYLKKEVFYETEPCYIYVERRLKNGMVRKGVVGCVDLECYDYLPGSTSSVRATEKTVVERIPPRLKVRKNAPVELPHIMLLADDRNNEIFEPLAAQKESFDVLYDFELMLSSGHICGYKLSNTAAKEFEEQMAALQNKDVLAAKYGENAKNPPILAVGDGNHSLATAKAYYEDLKKEIGDSALNTPARYVLAELVSLFDESLEFEAIHRVVFGVDEENFSNELLSLCTEADAEDDNAFSLLTSNKRLELKFKNPQSNLTVGDVQRFTDEYIARKGGTVDYIHGEDVVKELCFKENVGIILKPMQKDSLFKTVTLDGVLPRKTFSMGEAADKRFYVEARTICKDKIN